MTEAENSRFTRGEHALSVWELRIPADGHPPVWEAETKTAKRTIRLSGHSGVHLPEQIRHRVPSAASFRNKTPIRSDRASASFPDARITWVS